jgi:two-component system, NtrC family, sensor histidine kinase HydH
MARHVLTALRDRYRRLSLRTKFALHITLSTVLLFAALIPGVLYLESRAILDDAKQRGLQLTKIFAHASVQAVVADDFIVMRHLVNSIGSEPDVLYAMILDASGRALVHSDITQTGLRHRDALSLQAASTDRPLRQDIWSHGVPAYDFAIPIYVLTDQRAVARIGLSLERELGQIRRTRNLILGLGVVALLSGLGVAAWQARSVTRPIGELVQGAHAIAAGDLTHRIPGVAMDEVGQLGETFNRMATALAARIEELKAAQIEIVRQTRLAAIGEIAAVVAHEVRNPLGALANCVQLLRTGAQLSGDNAELLDIVRTESERLNRIVSDFLAFGRPRPPSFQPVDLRELIEETWAQLRRDERCPTSIVFAPRFGSDPLKVQADPDQLRQVFWNLFLNAAQAMAAGGTLSVESRRRADAIDIEIRDTGAGISEAALPRVFEPFYTGRAGGTGLGLAIVRRIVQDHGGDVTVESWPQVGTCFAMSLPVELSSPWRTGSSSSTTSQA